MFPTGEREPFIAIAGHEDVEACARKPDLRELTLQRVVVHDDQKASRAHRFHDCRR